MVVTGTVPLMRMTNRTNYVARFKYSQASIMASASCGDLEVPCQALELLASSLGSIGGQGMGVEAKSHLLQAAVSKE